MHPTASLRFNLKSGPVTIDEQALRQMKDALLSFVDGPELPAPLDELRAPMKAELASSAAFIQGKTAHVGVWVLEQREDRLTLVRYPEPERKWSYIYLAALERIGPGWKVTSLEQEREFGPK